MTTPEALNELADRCEAEFDVMSSPLDADIALAVGWTFDAAMPFWWRAPDSIEWVMAPPPYTTSLDAAVTLFPSKQWGVNWAIEGVHAVGFPGNVAICTYVWVDHPTNEANFVRSPGVAEYPDALKWLPRLITAAALRARVAMDSCKAGTAAPSRATVRGP